MTRERVKELLPIIQAFAEGKTVEFLNNEGKWVYGEYLEFSRERSRYRIKPEYRPFETKEECWNEMLKHQPFGWLIDKDGDYLLPATVGDETDFICRFRVLKFADGTPFGIREE